MSDDLTRLENWCEPLLAKLSGGERRKLARSVGTQLRRSQTQRIARQLNADGSAYAPRKPRLREKKGRIKRAKMFSKIRTAQYLRVRSDANAAAVEFTGRASRLARIHQEGGSDRVTKGGPTVRYPKRELLGFTPADIRMIRDVLVEGLAPK